MLLTKWGPFMVFRPAPYPERHLTGLTSRPNSVHNLLTSSCCTTHNWSSLGCVCTLRLLDTFFARWKMHWAYAEFDTQLPHTHNSLKAQIFSKLAIFQRMRGTFPFSPLIPVQILNYKRVLSDSFWHREGSTKQAVTVIKKKKNKLYYEAIIWQ